MLHKGALVAHAQGSLFPQSRIYGVVVEVFEKRQNSYKVFWYTTGRYQNLCANNLEHIKEKK